MKNNALKFSHSAIAAMNAVSHTILFQLNILYPSSIPSGSKLNNAKSAFITAKK